MLSRVSSAMPGGMHRKGAVAERNGALGHVLHRRVGWPEAGRWSSCPLTPPLRTRWCWGTSKGSFSAESTPNFGITYSSAAVFKVFKMCTRLHSCNLRNSTIWLQLNMIFLICSEFFATFYVKFDGFFRTGFDWTYRNSIIFETCLLCCNVFRQLSMFDR